MRKGTNRHLSHLLLWYLIKGSNIPMQYAFDKIMFCLDDKNFYKVFNSFVDELERSHDVPKI